MLGIAAIELTVCLDRIASDSPSFGTMSDKLVVGKQREFYTPAEVALHNCAEDCWVSIFGKVYDLSDFLSTRRGPLAQPIIRFAGEDISHWFDEETGDVKTFNCEETTLELPYCPHGRFIHVPPAEPWADYRTDFGSPWWRNPDLCIGTLSKKTQDTRIVNTLTRQEVVLEVCAEETLAQILDRYLDFNGHANSYTWKALDNGDFRPLDMSKTLEENGITDETEEFKRLRIETGFYIPVLHLYFNDDLTVA